MKTLTTLLAALLFSILFYDQEMGLNLTIFSFITVSLLLFQHPNLAKLASVKVIIMVYLLTAFLVYFNHSPLAILANCVAFFTLIGTYSESRSSIYIQWINGIYTTLASYFKRRKQVINQKESISKKREEFLKYGKLIGIPLAVGFGFILLYKNGNPIFNEFIERVNFDFINLKWLLLTLLGFFIFNNIINPIHLNSATQKDLETGNQLHTSGSLSLDQLKKEQQLGVILLSLLNILLIFYSLTDVYFLLTNDNMSASALSSQVHNGINTLIASIIIAIFIILYFFRGNLNFYKQNTTLKNLSYAWIILNIGLVLLIAIKNLSYVVVFGLTYKRIGVFIYLILTLAGLLTTFLKVRDIKNLWFLFRINARVAFVVLMVSSCIDWDYSITNYNLKHALSLDLNYLIDLSDNNTILLKDYAGHHQIPDFQHAQIQKKHDDFIHIVTHRNWQEWTFDNFKLSKRLD